jgi:hypothetical protein
MTQRVSPLLARAAYALALIALFLFTVLFRFLHLKDGFPNDHFLYIAGAQQIEFGDWPTKDFLDAGLPLMYVASALARTLLGSTLFAEAVLTAVAFALAAVLTAAAVRELTGSRLLALLAAVIEVAIVPRTYGYPKLLVYALGFFLLQRYVTRPTTRRLVAFAAATTIAFLFRHDHGIYLGIAGVIAAWLAAEPGHAPGGLRRAAAFFGLVALMTAPYLLYVQINGGIWAYIQDGLVFRNQEIARQPHIWPGLFGREPHQAALLYEYWSIPIIALVLLVSFRRREDLRTILARVAPITAVTFIVNWTFLRDPLNTRLQDAIAPAVILGSWLVACAWRSPRPLVWRPVSALLIVLVIRSVMGVGATIEQLDRASLLVTWRRLPEFIGELSTALESPHAERQLPSRTAHALWTFYPYLDRCTTISHRLLVAGFAPEVPVLTRRAFAGGQAGFVEGYYGSEAHQQSVLKHLSQEVVPFVVIPEPAANQFRSGFRLLDSYLRIRYEPLVTLGDPGQGVQILFDSALPVAARDPETGWPCEVANEWTVFAKGRN